MKNLLCFSIILMTTAAAFSQDMNAYIEKVSSTWDLEVEGCEKKFGTFTQELKNIGTESLDCQVCLQKPNKDWSCKTFLNIEAGKSVVFGICKSSGKSLKWSRKAGDEKIKFPTEMAVNNLY